MRRIHHNRESFFDLQCRDEVRISDQTYIVDGSTRGGMGCVYFLWKTADSPARMGTLGLRLALKAVLPDCADHDGIELFRRELAIWSGFRHPNIVTLSEILDGGDAGWVAAMNWCVGSLRDVAEERKTLSVKATTKIVADILEGLYFAYSEHRIHHLDLKPENVLYHLNINRMIEGGVSESDLDNFRFMISDWGISSIKQAALNEIAGNPQSDQTVRNTFNNMGTVLYMAPERFLRGHSSSIVSDVFSLGMIYHELITGVLPFSLEVDPVEEILTGKYYVYAKQQLNRGGFSKEVVSLILGMLHPRKTDRPDDFKKIAKALRRIFRRTRN